MGFNFDAESVRTKLVELLKQESEPLAWRWLEERLGVTTPAVLNHTFALIPRKFGKASLTKNVPGIPSSGMTLDRLARVCLLLHLDPSDEEEYFKLIDDLFATASVSELEALYGALPLFAHPHKWVFRCTEGIRSNIGTVLESIMYDNPYPAQYLPEPAWNQLIMKAFFTEKDISRIVGLEERANRDLSQILSDYAHERWAAGRVVPLALWKVAAICPAESVMADLRKLATEGTEQEKSLALDILGQHKQT